MADPASDASSRDRRTNLKRSPNVQHDLSDCELLKLYLSLSLPERRALFAGTAHTAKRAGLCRRTIEYWIDSGKIRAVRVGEKYQVYLRSMEEYLESRGTKGQ